MATRRLLWARQPSRAVVDEFLAGQTALPLSYPESGATSGSLPAGYRHDRWSADLGPYTDASFERAARALLTWSVHTGARMTVIPSGPVRDGATVALIFRLPLAGYVLAAGRVVRLIDEPGHAEFAYGTLPGHPEQGEEAFTVTRRHDRLAFEITAFSRPYHPLAKFVTPVTRLLQLRATRRYIAAMRKAIT